MICTYLPLEDRIGLVVRMDQLRDGEWGAIWKEEIGTYAYRFRARNGDRLQWSVDAFDPDWTHWFCNYPEYFKNRNNHPPTSSLILIIGKDWAGDCI